jgi:hypothetical protein
LNKYKNDENVLRALENCFDQIRAEVSNGNYSSQDFEKVSLKYRLISKIHERLHPGSFSLVSLSANDTWVENHVKPGIIERRKEQELKMKILGAIAAVVAWFTREPEVVAETTSAQVEVIKKAPEPAPAKFVIDDPDRESAKPVDEASGVIFSFPDKIAGTNEHVALCLRVDKVDEVAQLATKNDKGGFDITKFRYKFCLPAYEQIDVTFLFDNLKTFKAFLLERSQNAPTAEDFKKKIESGAKLIVYTYKNAGNLQPEFTEKIREVETYPTTSMIDTGKNNGKGIISFIPLSQDIVLGTSGSHARLGGDPNYICFQFAGYVNTGLLPNNKKYYRWNEQSHTYDILREQPNEKYPPQPGDILFIDLMKKEYEKAQKIHPDLKKIPWEVFVNQGNAIVLAPMTRSTYLTFRKDGILRVNLDLADQLVEGK